MVERLNPKVLAVTFTLVAFLLDLSGYVWHGLLGQPSFMNLLYPNFWSNWSLMLYYLVLTLVWAFVFGYVFALMYNWAAKKFK
ncbi:MAG TPA: hypothetical protein VJJ76_03845 [archaeon]|nr:hypothetical protein [archaeon]